jgi:serine/threonine protein kinase
LRAPTARRHSQLGDRPEIGAAIFDTLEELEAMGDPGEPSEDLPTMPRGESAFEALPTLEAIRIARDDEEAPPRRGVVARPSALGYALVERLGVSDGFEFFVGVDEAERRAIIKSALAGDGYDLRRRRLLDEADLALGLGSEAVTRGYGAGEDERGTHLAYEHVDGTSLERASARLRQRGEAFPFELCASITRAVASAISTLHAARTGLVLEDVLPAHIMVDRSGVVKLALFAFRLFGRSRPNARPMDAAYLAPERIMRSGSDPRTDVYSAGVLLFELASGRGCYSGLETRQVVAKVMHGGLPLRSLEREGVPRPLIDIVARATAHEPGDRFESAEALKDELDAWIDRSPDDFGPETLARFFDRQGLFDGDVAAPAGRFETILEVSPFGEDATEMIDAPRARRPTDFGDTLSAVVIREEIESPPVRSSPDVQPPPAPQALPPATQPPPPVDSQAERAASRRRAKAGGPALPVRDPSSPRIEPPVRVDETTFRLEVEPPPEPPFPAPSRPILVDARSRVELVPARPPVLGRPDRPRARKVGFRTLVVAAALSGATTATVAVLSSEDALGGRVIGVEVLPVPASPAFDAATDRMSVVIGSAPAAERGILEIDTAPPVRVFRGNELVGRTPIAIEVAAGPHELRFVEQSGGLATTRRYAVEPGKVTVDRIRFEKSVLEIEAPEGARLYLDQRYLGRAPVDRVEVFEGRHLLEVVAGQDTFADRLDVGPSQRIHYRVEVP